MAVGGGVSRKRKRRVLVADQSITIQKLVHLSLADTDVEVITASDTPDALTKIKRLRPEVVILENQLPELQNPKLSAELEEEVASIGTKLILLQSKQEPLDKRIQSENDVLMKPFDSKILVESINRLMEEEIATPIEGVKETAEDREESPFYQNHLDEPDLQEALKEEDTAQTKIALSSVDDLPEAYEKSGDPVTVPQEEASSSRPSVEDRLLAIADEVANTGETPEPDFEEDTFTVDPHSLSEPTEVTSAADTIELNEDSLIGASEEKTLASTAVAEEPTPPQAAEAPVAIDYQEIARSEVKRWIDDHLPEMAERLIKDELSRLK